MLYEFLQKNKIAILQMTEKSSLKLAGLRASSTQLERGLPIFYKQLLTVLKKEESQSKNEVESAKKEGEKKENPAAMRAAATETNEPALAAAQGHPEDSELALEAGRHGSELMRLGYTLSHVVHAYGAMCQSITELAVEKDFNITAQEFQSLNRCLDVAIAGSVTEYQTRQDTETQNREIEHLGTLAHELRNRLSAVRISLQLIKDGTVGFAGQTGKILERNIDSIENLITRALTEVRLRVDPEVHLEEIDLMALVNDIVTVSDLEAQKKQQTLSVDLEPDLKFQGDPHLLTSAISNVIQNALKFTREGGLIQVRAKSDANEIMIEVEDQCGGKIKNPKDLFKPFVQQHTNKAGVGLGLTIAQRALAMNGGEISVENLPGKGCIFRMSLPLVQQSQKRTSPRPETVQPLH